MTKKINDTDDQLKADWQSLTARLVSLNDLATLVANKYILNWILRQEKVLKRQTPTRKVYDAILKRVEMYEEILSPDQKTI